MKLGLLTALLTSVLICAAAAATITMTPPPAQNKAPAPPKVLPAPAKPSPQIKTQTAAKADCPCNCPQKARHTAARTRPAHHAMHRNGRDGHYHYAAAAPWHGPWRGPMLYGPPPGYDVEGLRLEDGGWTGGVGTAPDGGGGFVDGYGQVHFANGGDNGPTYNSYGQSFQYNPSQAGPFQPRLMGGFAPPSTGSR